MTDSPSSKSAPNELDFVTITGAEAFGDAACKVISGARIQLSIMSVALEKPIYGTERFANDLRNFILEHRRARLRILVHDPVSAVRNCIRLVELGRMLSSRIEFRRASEKGQRLLEEYLVADEEAVLHRSSPDQLEARYYARAPMVARSQLKAFDGVWEESPVAREMSALGL